MTHNHGPRHTSLGPGPSAIGDRIGRLADSIDDQPWTADALCATVDPDLFYPEKSERFIAAAAKSICRRCPVTTDCLTYAIDNNEPHGIWGGQSARERQQHRRKDTPA